MISVVTPWRNHTELILAYESAVDGAEVIVVDNASDAAEAQAIREMVMRLDGIYIRNDRNRYFSPANNQGLRVATGDVVLFLNNDIEAEAGWLAQVERDITRDDALYGASSGMQIVAGKPLMYLEGWCIGARRAVWDILGGWDEVNFALPYWDDNDLCWRALQAGVSLSVRAGWQVRHLSNTTSRTEPDAYTASERNRRYFEEQVKAHG